MTVSTHRNDPARYKPVYLLFYTTDTIDDD